jgi:hypothetical protein
MRKPKCWHANSISLVIANCMPRTFGAQVILARFNVTSAEAEDERRALLTNLLENFGVRSALPGAPFVPVARQAHLNETKQVNGSHRPGIGTWFRRVSYRTAQSETDSVCAGDQFENSQADRITIPPDVLARADRVIK